MALEGSYEDQYGNSYSSAYYMMSTVFVDNKNQTVRIRMEVFSDQTARDNGKQPLTILDPLSEDDADDPSTVFSDHFSTGNYGGSDDPWAKAYSYVKNLSKFSGMTDA